VLANAAIGVGGGDELVVVVMRTEAVIIMSSDGARSSCKLRSCLDLG
jgi:hypothetical protein